MRLIHAMIPAAAGLMLAACASSPDPASVNALADARVAVATARAAGADTASPGRLDLAEAKLAEAHVLADDGKDEEAQLRAEEARAEANAALAEATAADAAAAETRAAVAETQLAAALAELQAKESARGTVVTIGDVFFRTDSADLTPEGYARVASLAGVIGATPGQAIVIEGHADATGDASYNLTLSEQRAASVAAALLAAGVTADRIVYTGRGESAPVATNATASGRQLNRRVDVIFVDRV